MLWAYNSSKDFDDYLATQRKFLEMAFNEWGKHLDVEFVEVENNAHNTGMIQVRFHEFGTIRSRIMDHGSIYAVGGLNSNPESLNPQAVFASDLHELGHALGLRHPFHDHGDGYGPFSAAERTKFNSIMSYGRPAKDRVITQNDINALQFLYGIPGTDYHGLYAEIEDWFNQPGHDAPVLL